MTTIEAAICGEPNAILALLCGNKIMNIETELIHKWEIGDEPVFGSGSLKDIQALCNECAKLRKQNDDKIAAIHAAHELIAPLGYHVNPCVLTIRNATSILRSAI